MVNPPAEGIDLIDFGIVKLGWTVHCYLKRKETVQIMYHRAPVASHDSGHVHDVS